MAFEGSLYVNINSPIIDGICGMVSQHLIQHLRSDPLVDDFECELVAELRANQGQDFDLVVLVMTVVARIYKLSFDLDQAAGLSGRLDLKSGPSSAYKATSELGFHLRQTLARYAHRQTTPA